MNVGCTSVLVARIERRAEEHAEATGGPVVLLGQSRGGWLSRLVAVRRPDLVHALVTAVDENMAALREPLPDGMPALAVYSRLDRVVPWQLCQDPSAECVEVRSGHSGMLPQPEFYSALELRLSRWATSVEDHEALRLAS